MRRPSARRRRRAAFTLMEVLLVVAILLILGSIVVVSFSGIMRGAEDDTTRTQMQAISNGVKAYYARHRAAPDELRYLIENPGTTQKQWYKVLETDTVPQDAWGRDFVYTPSVEGFVLESYGADGAQGTPDDIRIEHGY